MPLSGDLQEDAQNESRNNGQEAAPPRDRTMKCADRGSLQALRSDPCCVRPSVSVRWSSRLHLERSAIPTSLDCWPSSRRSPSGARRGYARVSVTRFPSSRRSSQRFCAAHWPPASSLLRRSLGEFRRPYLRWASYTASRVLTAVATGLAALAVFMRRSRVDSWAWRWRRCVAAFLSQVLDTAFVAFRPPAQASDPAQRHISRDVCPSRSRRFRSMRLSLRSSHSLMRDLALHAAALPRSRPRRPAFLRALPGAANSRTRTR